jgi:hypothetical protein
MLLTNVGLLTWIGLFFFILFFYGPWQKGLTDWYREKAFAVRDELFDCASRGEISFSDPDYVTTRDTLNNQIRFAHRATWLNVLIYHLTLRFMGSRPARRRVCAFPDIVAVRIGPKLKMLERELFAQMVFRSLFVVPILVSILVISLVCRYAIKVVIERFSRFAFEEAQSAANAEPSFSRRFGRAIHS